MIDIAAQQQPVALAHPARKSVGDRREIEVVEQFHVELLNLGDVEMRRGAAEGGEVEALGQFGEASAGLNRLRGAEAREQRVERHRLDPRITQFIDPRRAEPLGQFAFCGDQQSGVRQLWQSGAERGEHLQLDRAVGDMILAAQDVGDGEVDVVDHAWQEVQPATVGAADDRVADQGRIELLVAADEIVPFDRGGMVELEAPVRGDALGHGGVRGLALVGRRKLAAEQDLALDVELFWGFVAGIDPAGIAQFFELALVQVEPLGLAERRGGDEAEPIEIGVDRVDMLVAAAIGIGIVDAQQEAPAGLRAEQIIMQRGADVADVEAPGRGRSEAGNGHGAQLGARPRAVTPQPAQRTASGGSRRPLAQIAAHDFAGP